MPKKRGRFWFLSHDFLFLIWVGFVGSLVATFLCIVMEHTGFAVLSALLTLFTGAWGLWAI